MFKSLLLIGAAWMAVCPHACAQQLSLSQAVELALKSNLQTAIAQERIVQSRGERGLSMSGLLPNLSGAAYQMNLTSNLAALGLPVGKFPGLNAFVPPFNRFDARFQLMQSVFSLAAIRRYQTGREAVRLAEQEQRLAAHQVTATAALAYLLVLEAEQSVETAQANVQLGQRLLELANSQKNAGVATGVDVVRAETRLANQQVQVAQARTNLDTARLNLLRVIGSPLSSTPVLVDRLKFEPEPPPEPSAAVSAALDARPEIRVLEDQVHLAGLQRRAAAAEWTPSVSFFGDYGSSGLRPDRYDLPTRSVGIRLDVPIFNGGRTRSQIDVASSQQRQAELRLADTRMAIEKDVRQAIDALVTRQEQVKAAQKTVALAQRELELSQDRFKSGVADNIEVTNAQTALENARQVLVSSLAQYNIARLNLASALGRAQDFKL